MKDSSFHKLYALLRPEVRPRLGAILLLFVLGSISALGTKAPLMFIAPLWGEVLFPEEGATQVEEKKTAGYEAFMSAFDAASDALGAALYGAQPSLTDERMAALWTVGLGVVLFTIVASIAIYIQTLLVRWVAVRMVIDLRVRLTRHLMGLSMRYHGGRRFGDLLSRMSSDTTKTLGVVQQALRDLVQQPLMIVVSIAIAAGVAPQATLVFVLLLPIVALPIGLLGRRVRKRSKRSLDKLGDSVEVLAQVFTGIRTVKSYRAEERELERYREINDGYLAAAMRVARAVGAIRSSSHLLSHVGFAAVLLAVGWISIKGSVFSSSTDMITFLGAVGMIYTHVKRITSAVNHIQEAAGAADRLQVLLDEPADIVEKEGAHALETLGAGIRFEDVSFAYAEADGRAIDGLTLEIRAGETLAVVGPSGAGKTTAIDLIARFIDPDEGRVTVDGRDLKAATLDSWTSLYALVGQVPFLFHDTIGENIRYGNPKATQTEVEAAARAAHIHDFVAGLPEGYDTPVGDEGSRLSGGQRQRITIARAILKGAPLLLLDEATSALDSESEAEVQRALEELMSDRTVIVIAHRLSTVRNADRIVVLEAGRLVELGSHDELLAKNGAYARLHRVQFPEQGGDSA